MSNNQANNSKQSKVQFNGLNHSRWSRALKTEMQELEVSAVMSQDASNRIVSLPTADDLLVMELAQFDNSGAVIPANDKKAYIKCVKSLRQMDQKAQAILIQSLQEGKKPLVRGATTAWEMSKMVERVFQQNSLENRETIRLEINTAQMSSFSDPMAYLLHMKDLREDLVACGDSSMTEEALIMHILCRFPDKYKSVKEDIYREINARVRAGAAATATAGAALPTQDIFEFFQSQLHLKIKRDKLAEMVVSQSQSNGVQSLLTRARSDNGDNRQRARKKQKVSCANCGKTGHSESQCWADGGGDVANRPDWYQPSRTKEKKANSKSFGKSKADGKKWKRGDQSDTGSDE
ncbi:hypothetical protein MP228_012724 [Amoeboaphelidium protococcarum]|nr:hypothetical protein MP228_012724 [Amoeboaphelidium protococcarum]